MTDLINDWQEYCWQKLPSIEICLHAKKRMKMRAWEELKDLTREELIRLIRNGRLLVGSSGYIPPTYFVEIVFARSKICVVIDDARNQLKTVYNEHYNYDGEELRQLPVKEQQILRRQAKAYHQELEIRYANGEFRGRIFKF